ncbi:Aspartyl protease family protein [Camellia lanceoleosa]|uniref:Aspartyl protease family protein n=1 Tax=Camellia lanceoleosa TaxID=1840588 RepID=A0ACC0FLM3_9ERIC|nr:Aspartyl protease family protein [Camellia lanceoleosa]
MATSISTISISSLFFACLVSLFLHFLEKGCALHDENTLQSHHHTLRVSSLLPASICNSSTNGHSKRASSLKVVHKHGPCSHLNLDKASAPTVTQILSDDEFRVNSIHSQLMSNSSQNSPQKQDPQANLPVNSGASIGTGNFIVTVGLGTPKKDLTLLFDTGSDLTWTQCQPCLGSCYQQQQPIFDPSESTTYKNISCDSAECTQLSSNAGGVFKRCSTSTCIYGIQYADQSYSIGYFSKDTLTLTPTDVLPNFRFGCGQSNDGLFGGAAGLLGLARNQLSVVSQTSSKYGKYFSYCLPSTSSSTGHLTFGKGGKSNSRSLKFTPFSKNSNNPSFYFIDMTGIKVGGQKLSIAKSVFDTAGAVIDSGTVISRLPPAAYGALRTAFRKLMKDYPMTQPVSILDTCYDFSNYNTVSIPKISFYFNRNVEVPIDLSGILFGQSVSQVCLAFAGNSNASSLGIFGNTQQLTLEVVYDVARGKLGFGTRGCS